EAQFGAMLPRNLPQETVTTLQQSSRDFVAQQQYLDFVRCTPFRHSILCHKAIQLKRQPAPAVLEHLHISAQAKVDPAPIGAVDPRNTNPLTFTGPGGKLTSNRPLMKAAMLHLMSRWPGTVPFPELAQVAGMRIDSSPVRTAQQVQAEKELLGSILLKGYMASDLLEFHAAPLTFLKLSDRPTASA